MDVSPRNKPPNEAAQIEPRGPCCGERSELPNSPSDGKDREVCTGRWPHRSVSELAGRQRGLISSRQLRELGVSRPAIARAAAAGALWPIHRGVYGLMPLHSLPPLATEQAALLACGERVILSHATAAAIWGLRPPSPPHVVLTAIGRDVRPRPAIEVHRTRAIDRRDVRRRHGLPVSAPARTLLDIAPTLSDRQLEKVFDEAMVSGIMRRSEARAMVERHPRHRDIQRLRALAYEDRETAWTRAVSEERLLELIRIAGLPAPEVNTSYGRYELDFFWPSERVAIEIDGERFHAHRRALERDHGRDAALQLAGIVVIRFTWRQLRDEPLAVVAQIAGALGRRAAQPSVRASAVSAMNS